MDKWVAKSLTRLLSWCRMRSANCCYLVMKHLVTPPNPPTPNFLKRCMTEAELARYHTALTRFVSSSVPPFPMPYILHCLNEPVPLHVINDGRKRKTRKMRGKQKGAAFRCARGFEPVRYWPAHRALGSLCCDICCYCNFKSFTPWTASPNV